MVPNAAVGNWTVLGLIKEAKLLKNRIDRNGPMFTRAKTDLSYLQCAVHAGKYARCGYCQRPANTKLSQNMIECENVTAC